MTAGCLNNNEDMSRKKDGIPFEVQPTPAKGKDGRNIVYVRPAMRDKLLMKGVDEFCSRNYGLRFGELTRAFDVFQMAAAELMAMGYRIDTPIGSFAPRLKLVREITDPDDVKSSDIRLDGVEYNPGKLWDKALKKWENGFRRVEKANSQALLADEPRLEKALQENLKKYNGYVTARSFSYYSGLTYYSARKQLDKWCEGRNPKLLKTHRGQQYIYTEI